MFKAMSAFLVYLSTAKDKDLVKQIEYLKTENRILRSKLPKKLTVTAAERKTLLRLGKRVGAALKHLITIVCSRTFTRWVQAAKGGEKPPAKTRKPGRPRTPEDIEALVVRLASENDWGYTRILGELKKLNVGKISRSTVLNILRRHDLEPGPKRGKGSWVDFVERHVTTLWACDFFTVPTWTRAGLVDLFVLLFIHVGTRRVTIAGITANPDDEWVTQQAKGMCITFDEQGMPTHLIHDRDAKFTARFDGVMASEGIDVVKIPFRSPNMNPHCERVIQSIKTECLDHFIVFGEKHLRHLLREYLAYYHEERPHQGMGNRPLGQDEEQGPPTPLRLEDLRCQERLGGLLKHYSRAA